MKNFLKSFFLALSLVFAYNVSTAQTVGGITTGTDTYCTTTNSGFVTLTGHNGNILFWQLSTNGGLNWINIGNTNINQTYFNLNQTTCYRAVVQDGSYPTDTSTIVCINIYPPTIAGVLSGGGLFCGSNATGNLTLAGNTGSVLNWEFSINNGTTWSAISNTTNTENIGSVTQTRLYRVIIQSGSCPNDTSNIDTVTVTPQTVAGTINGPNSVCAGSNSGTLNLTGYTGAILDWIVSTNNGASWSSLGNTTANYNFSNITQTTWYKAIIQSGACNLDSTITQIITVDPATIPGTITGGGSFCGSTASGTITLSGYSGSIIKWEYSINNGSTWTTISNITDTEVYTNLSQTTLYKANIQSGNCALLSSNIDTVFVTPQTVAGVLTPDTTICPVFNQFNLTLQGSIGDILYWQYSTDGGASWQPITNTNNILPLSGISQTTLYNAVVQSGNCNLDTSNTITVTVFPINIISAGNDTTINLGESATLNGSGIGIPIWSPASDLDNATILTPIATPNFTTTFTLTIQDNNNCLNFDTVIVTINDTTTLSTAITITNLFTPNGDGYNDYWYIQNIENIIGNEVFVYNIYGALVYSQKNYTNDWTGTYNGDPLPDGTYYYIVKVNESEKPLKGSLDILR